MSLALKNALRERHKLSASADVRMITTKLAVSSPESSNPYKFTARITTDAIDRQDEVVIPEGGQFLDFLNSGAIFWNHDYNKPVGYPDKTKSIIKGQNFVEAGGVFMARPEGHQGDWFPDFVREFVIQGMKAGINPGVSIGFIPVESRRPSKADIVKYGNALSVVHSKWKLLEFSIAPMQANQEAVVTAVGKGLIKKSVAEAVGFKLPEIAPPSKIQKCILAIPKAKEAPTADQLVKHHIRREVYKMFGRVVLPA